jgi:aerobic-type carbon monoxide dehydrogenase small subunit (CoxS/CutS family)
MKVTLTVNGKTADVEVDDPNMPLLYALRDSLALRGPRQADGKAVGRRRAVGCSRARRDRECGL